MFDFHPTPRQAVLPLIPWLRAAPRVRQFCEPCCGDGALVRHLESFGLTCVLASDIASGQDALAIPSFPAPAVTNPPYSPQIRDALIAHFIAAAPFNWLLLKADWAYNKGSSHLVDACSDIVVAGRLRLFEGTPNDSTDNFGWFRFSRDHHGGPIFHPWGAKPAPGARLKTCELVTCRRPFKPQRSDARYCCPAHRQRAYEEREPSAIRQ